MMQAGKTSVIDIKEQIVGRLTRIGAEHLAKCESTNLRPMSSNNPALLNQLSGLESVQKMSGLSPSREDSAHQIVETNRENNEDGEDEAKEDEQVPETASVKMSPDEILL